MDCYTTQPRRSHEFCKRITTAQAEEALFLGLEEVTVDGFMDNIRASMQRKFVKYRWTIKNRGNGREEQRLRLKRIRCKQRRDLKEQRIVPPDEQPVESQLQDDTSKDS
nr:hypothetical protein CFP56_13346 [Quercus suber]